jgi:cyclopropane fatty-acyl-phospholipid synthase-like methyltransferase
MEEKEKERNKISNLKLFEKKEADKYYQRNIKYYKNNSEDEKLSNFLKLNLIQGNTILEIGCCNGKKLDQYRRYLGSSKTIGTDISKKAINEGKKIYRNIAFKNISSLEIDKLQTKFDIIICGFFLYLLDRDQIFNQFNLIYKNLKTNGFLIIEDFDPLFKHTNKNIHQKKLLSFKMSYSNFLEESGLFKMIYKIRYDIGSQSNKEKRKFKNKDTSISLYKKIDFNKSYPTNL